MGRCGWGVGAALVLAVLGASCGGTGGGPSDSGNQFVFTARGRLNLAVQTTSDPKKLILTATLLDPQGVPFRNQPIMFTAEFPDATFIPGNDNKGSVLTDDSGQASITLIAGLTIGKMRVIVEAPPALNISTGITVTLTEQGFVSVGPLGIIPSSVTFVNPAPHPPGGPADFTFQATGGDPPYKFSNSNTSVGKIETTGTAGSLGQYTLTGPLPTSEGDARKDTVIVQDTKGIQARADVLVLFVTCALNLNPGKINFNGARGGEKADIFITNGVPPYTATHTFPAAGNLLINQQTNTVTYVVATPPLPVGDNTPDTVLIRDSRNCTGTVNVTIVPANPQKVTTFVLTANPNRINGVAGGTSTITALVLDEDSKPIQSLSVFFVTDKGSISPLSATTNSNGQATTILTIPAGTPTGVAKVTGFARGVPSDPVTVTIFAGGPGGGGPPANIFIDLFADRSGNNNDGTCTTILSALVVDAVGKAVNDGTSVSWAATPATTVGGGSAAVAVTSPTFTNQDPPCDTSTYKRDTGPDITPQPGDALTCLKYPQSAAGGTVSVAAVAGTASTTRTITLPPCPFATTVQLQANPTVINGATGGTSTITATVLNASNQPVGGVTVAFSTTIGTLSPSRATTDASGQATVTLTIPSGTAATTATVTGTVPGGAKGTVGVTINAAIVVLQANPTVVKGTAGGTSTITATVLDANNQPLGNVTVAFSTDKGTLSSSTETTNANGQTMGITLTIPVGTLTGTATVTGTVPGGAKEGKVVVTIT